MPPGIPLFDLRDKEIEVIEEVRSMYNFLAPRFRDDTLVYLIMSPKYYKDIYTTDNVSKSHRDSTMYLPHIESFHINSLSIDKIDVIYRVKLTDALFDCIALFPESATMFPKRFGKDAQKLIFFGNPSDNLVISRSLSGKCGNQFPKEALISGNSQSCFRKKNQKKHF